MFYSHDILTSDKHGVATIWLLATLGSRSAARKVNRRAILGVDVPKACDTIMHSDAPMALRLQGNLLYGVSKVYNQQCAYTLTDTQTMHDKLRASFKIILGTGLDVEAGKVKPDQLILPYDPTFLPELNLPGLYLDLGLSTATEPRRDFESSLISTTFKSSGGTRGNRPLSINISSPEFLTNSVGGFGPFGQVDSSVRKGSRLGGTSFFEDEEGMILKTDFEFDEDGNIIELTNHGYSQGFAKEVDSIGGYKNQMKEGTGEELQLDQAQLGEAMDLDPENGMLAPGSLDILPPGESFGPGHLPDPDYGDEFGATSEAREVAMRSKKRTNKALSRDEPQELLNADLAKWNNEYLHNMLIAREQKQQNKLSMQAKKNASFWVFDQGIGSVGLGIGISREIHPLQCFSGEQLLETFYKREVRNAGRKRLRSLHDEEGSSEESRRFRARVKHLDRGNDNNDGNDGDVIIFADTGGLAQDDIEVGRHAPPSLYDDVPSQMPWNITASIQGSRHGSSVPSLTRPFGSVDSSSHRQPANLGRHGHRFASSSPLAGRGLVFEPTRLNRHSSFSVPGIESDDLDTLGDFDSNTNLDENHFDPANTKRAGNHGSRHALKRGAAAETRIGDELQWLTSTLDEEPRNFLEFMNGRVESLIAEQIDVAEERGPREKTEILFSFLLPPETTTRAIATQALMHILTLATKDILAVRQEASYQIAIDAQIFGEIILRLKAP